MLRKIRLTLAILFFGLITLLFLDFTGTIHAWFGWMAKIQFLPAVLALNVAVIVFLVALTLIFGRVYCSVICPLGVLQDLFGWMGKKQKKNRYSYSPAKNWLRYGVLVLFVAALVAGVGSFVALLAPYSSFGRIASNLLAPLYGWGNNLLAYFAERMDSYAFYEAEVWIASLPTFIIAAVTLVVLIVLAWRGGRTYCNTICPVGTVLGVLSRFSWLAPVIDTEKCNACGLCARNCKASCIDSKNHQIDYSRCVACMDCIEKCNKGAISYRPRKKQAKAAPVVDESRRSALTATAILASTSLLKAQEKKRDGGLAVIEDKVVPVRGTRLVPPGALSIKNFEQHCTACQLCVSVCPNDVLRPSTGLLTLMQPEMGYENGYCRPECTKCGDVCPAGAIKPITREEKSSRQIGHAVWIKKNCIMHEDKVDCGKCKDACPTGAIQIVVNESCPNKCKNVVVNTERCIGCGACEHLCPVRPLSAIYVEGHEVHREI
ncbi:MAG: 4Fe-4S binding protein [Mediterranea massiliensis]|nr:4Fe-4S binding protein [Mediterranea massiliensis]